MRWFALGLKLRLETESPGGGFTCTERRKPSIESARAEGFHHLDRGRQAAGNGHACARTSRDLLGLGLAAPAALKLAIGVRRCWAIWGARRRAG
jgi:hypothetical protein